MHSDEPEGVVALSEETLSIDKRSVVVGKVRVRTETDTVESAANVDLQHEGFEVTRVEMNRAVDAVPPVRTDGDLTIFSVVEEVVVVEKRLVLKEEIHLRRLSTRESVEVPVTLRRQRAILERIDPETGQVVGNPLQPER